MNRLSPVVEMRNVSKSFGGVQAVKDVTLSLYRREVLGIVGDNGAGKSTLIKMLAGVFPPDKGQILLNGKVVAFDSPRNARELGISTVHQSLALCDNLDVSTNIFLGVELKRNFVGMKFINKRAMREKTKELLRNLNIDLPSVTQSVKYLSGGQRQAVAIAKALAIRTPIVLILDEPTAGLAAGGAVKKVRTLIKQLKEEGVSVILISHDLEDIFATTDRTVVLRHGELVYETATSQTSRGEIISYMITAAADVNTNIADQAYSEKEELT